jgi:hypothetical protein
VEAAPNTVQADTNEISTVINGTQLTQLETNGRSLYSLVNLVPGASSMQGDFQTPTPMGGDQRVSFNGARIAHALYMVDGGEAADRGGSGAIVMPSLDSLSEFRVLSSNYSAEYGLVSGATITTAVKSGTDKIHSSAWWFGRNDALDARNFFNPTGKAVTELRFNLWGFNIGGPVKFHKDSNPKTFFFFNMEWRDGIQGAAINRAVPFQSSYGGNLTDAVNFGGLFSTGGVHAPFQCRVSSGVAAAFAAAGQALSGCTGGSPNNTLLQPFVFNGQQNVINPALINANAAALLKAGIFPGVTSGDAFVGGPNAPTNVREEIARMDHTFNPHWAIFGHWISEQILQTDVPARWGSANLPTSADTFGNPSYSGVVHVTNTISPTLLNEIAFNYDANRISILPQGVFNLSGTGFTSNRLFSGPNSILPQISLNGRTGATYSEVWTPWNNSADDFQLRDDVSWVRGKHQLRMGASWANFRKAQPLQDSPQGSFQFNGGFTGYDFADFLLGMSSNYSEAPLKDTRHWNSVSYATYFQDDWRVNKRLTLNLGLRWDGIPHTAEINGQMSNFYLNMWNAAGAAAAFAPGSGIGFANATGSQICSGAGIPNASCTGANPFLGSGPNPALNGLVSYINGLGVPGKNGITNGLVPNYWATFGPRVGLAYDLTGRGNTVLRAGFGTFYERIQGNDMYQAGANNLFGGNPSIGNVSLSNPHIGVDQNNSSISASTLPVTVNSITMLNSNQYKIPTTYQFSAGIQQQFGRRSVLSVAYVGNVGRHESEATEMNMPALSQLPTFFSAGGYNGLVNLSRPFLGYSSIKVDQFDANSHYNSLQVSLRSQFHGLQLQGAYTYAKSVDSSLNGSNGGDGGDLDVITNPYQGWRFDLGPSELNREHVANVNFIYDIPFFRTSGSRLLKNVAGGWQLSGVVTMETGLPLNLGISTSALGAGNTSVCAAISGNCQLRPNLVGTISYPKTGATLSSSGFGSMQWFDPSAFAFNTLPGLNNVATWGNLGENGVWGPGRDNWNLAMFKNIAATERLHFELRVESYNTFNHPQMNGVNTTLGSKDFGKVTSAYDPRVFQLGGKIIF